MPLTPPQAPDDPYARVNYRSMIGWQERLTREAPLLRRVFASAASRSLLDLGCGTGEHARFLASEGFAVTGVDASPVQLAAAREAGGGPAFVEGNLEELGPLVGTGYGGALCVGNTLAHLLSPAALARFLAGLSGRLLPGAAVLLQLLNYARILGQGERALPVNLRPGESPGEEIVFLRLMTPGENGAVVFTPTTLRYRPHGEPPVEVVSTKNVLLRSWRYGELRAAAEEAGLGVEATWGGMQEEPFDERTSRDLVLLLLRRS